MCIRDSLIPLAIGLAILLDSRTPTQRRWLFVPIFLVCLAEQGAALPSYDKSRVRQHVEAIAAAVPRDAEAFLYTPEASKIAGWHWLRDHVDSMWVSFETGVPTLNGYSGKHPRGWSFYDIQVKTPSDLERLDRARRAWLEHHGRDRNSIPWIR